MAASAWLLAKMSRLQDQVEALQRESASTAERLGECERLLEDHPPVGPVGAAGTVEL
jgi:hypothetical protein